MQFPNHYSGKLGLTCYCWQFSHFFQFKWLSLLIALSASRESAYLHAITAAGVAHAVTASCSAGNTESCDCDRSHSGVTNKGWTWSGCSSNIRFGSRFSEQFTDARARGNSPRAVMNRHNNRAGRKVGAYMKVSLMFTSFLWLNLRGSNMFSEVSNSVGSQKFRNINNKQKPPTVLTWPDTTNLAMFPKLYKIQTFSFFRNVATKSFCN